MQRSCRVFGDRIFFNLWIPRFILRQYFIFCMCYSPIFSGQKTRPRQVDKLIKGHQSLLYPAKNVISFFKRVFIYLRLFNEYLFRVYATLFPDLSSNFCEVANLGTRLCAATPS